MTASFTPPSPPLFKRYTMNWAQRIRLPHKASPSSSWSDAEIPASDHGRKRTQSPSSPTSAVEHIVASPTTTKSEPAKTVRFSDVHVRRYNRIVGDNPYVEVPLGIGWDYSASEVSSVDEHEEHQFHANYVNANDLEPLEYEQRLEKLLACGLPKELINREERRRKLIIAHEWAYRMDPTDATPCTCRHGKIFLQRYILV